MNFWKEKNSRSLEVVVPLCQKSGCRVSVSTPYVLRLSQGQQELSSSYRSSSEWMSDTLSKLLPHDTSSAELGSEKYRRTCCNDACLRVSFSAPVLTLLLSLWCSRLSFFSLWFFRYVYDFVFLSPAHSLACVSLGLVICCFRPFPDAGLIPGPSSNSFIRQMPQLLWLLARPSGCILGAVSSALKPGVQFSPHLGAEQPDLQGPGPQPGSWPYLILRWETRHNAQCDWCNLPGYTLIRSPLPTNPRLKQSSDKLLPVF